MQGKSRARAGKDSAQNYTARCKKGRNSRWIALGLNRAFTERNVKMIEYLEGEFTISPNQEDLFTSHHTKYCYRIIRRDRKSANAIEIDYQCNSSYQPTLKDVLYCLISDADAFQGCEDLADFLVDYGYIENANHVKQGINAYKGCEENHKKLHDMFADEEIEELRNEVE